MTTLHFIQHSNIIMNENIIKFQIHSNVLTKIKAFVLVFFIPFIINAQEDNYNISGSVFDKTDGKALVSVSIYYANNNIKGTITNVEGEFIIEKISETDSLIFSYLGYGTQKYSINNIPQIIYLEPLTINLPEVVVTPGYANTIVKRIWDKYNKIYKENKKNKNKESSFFYRQITQTNGVYNEFIECFLTGKNTFDIDGLNLYEGRYARVKKDSTVYFTFTNFFYMSQITPFKEKPLNGKTIQTFIQPGFETFYYVDIDNNISDKDGNIIILKFQPKKQYTKDFPINSGKLYIRESDLSIIRFEGITQKNTQFQVNYKERTGTYPIVESVLCNSSFETDFKKPDQSVIKLKVNVVSTLVEIDLQLDDSGKKIKKDDVLIKAIQKKKYNSEFWKNNPIVKRTKIDDEIIRAFESANLFGDLEKN